MAYKGFSDGRDWMKALIITVLIILFLGIVHELVRAQDPATMVSYEIFWNEVPESTGYAVYVGWQPNPQTYAPRDEVTNNSCGGTIDRPNEDRMLYVAVLAFNDHGDGGPGFAEGLVTALPTAPSGTIEIIIKFTYPNGDVVTFDEENRLVIIKHPDGTTDTINY